MMALTKTTTTATVTTSRPVADEEIALETNTDNKRSTKQRQPQQHEPGQSSRTSLTDSITDSWMSSASSPTGGGVEVPPLLQSLFGLDFLPYSTILEDEAGEARAAVEEAEETTKGVPRSVEIKSEGGENGGHYDQTSTYNNDCDTVSLNEQGEVCAVHRHCPTRVPTPEREELQEMLLHAQGGTHHHNKLKKKRPGKRMKAAVKGVFHKIGSVGRRRGGGSLAAASTSASLKSNLTVNTRDNGLPPLSPVTTTSEASLTPLNNNNSNNHSSSIHYDAKSCLQKQVQLQEESVQKTHQEIEQLQQSLAASIEKYQAQLLKLQQTQQELQQKAAQANAQSSVLHTSSPANLDFETNNHKDAASEPAAIVHDENPRVLKRSQSASFMRVSDLDLVRAALAAKDSPSLSSLSQSAHSTNHAKQQETGLSVDDRTPEFLLMDHYLLEIVQQLILKGYHLVTDEGNRFVPTKETEKLLMQKPKSSNGNKDSVDPNWPIHPWTASWDQHVLVWTGHVPHEGFGSKWPVVKGRTILFASARTVLEYLWDSSQVPKYNPMSQGRSDVYTLQDNVETAAHESPYGLAGCAKIVQSVNKHRLLPKGIEMKSLLYARPLEEHTGSYILVSRSVWENNSATMPESHSKNVIRSEMLLGCTLLRAIDDQKCEMTQLTHAYSPGVPEMLVRRTAPGQCSTLMKAMQAQFPPPN